MNLSEVKITLCQMIIYSLHYVQSSVYGLWFERAYFCVNVNKNFSSPISEKHGAKIAHLTRKVSVQCV
jgi:hypothetical protein